MEIKMAAQAFEPGLCQKCARFFICKDGKTVLRGKLSGAHHCKEGNRTGMTNEIYEKKQRNWAKQIAEGSRVPKSKEVGTKNM